VPHINYLAVLVSGVVIFMLGGLWYSPVLFAKKWMALQVRTAEDMSGGGYMAAMYVQVFVCGLLTAWVLAILIEFLPEFGMMRAVKLAILCWLGFAAATSYGTSMFSMKPKALWLIDTAFNLVSFVIAAVILAAWR
jgi:hypothetical protein